LPFRIDVLKRIQGRGLVQLGTRAPYQKKNDQNTSAEQAHIRARRTVGPIPKALLQPVELNGIQALDFIRHRNDASLVHAFG
jgi:hypothetical protein